MIKLIKRIILYFESKKNWKEKMNEPLRARVISR